MQRNNSYLHLKKLRLSEGLLDYLQRIQEFLAKKKKKNNPHTLEEGTFLTPTMNSKQRITKNTNVSLKKTKHFLKNSEFNLAGTQAQNRYKMSESFMSS